MVTLPAHYALMDDMEELLYWSFWSREERSVRKCMEEGDVSGIGAQKKGTSASTRHKGGSEQSG